MVAFRWRRAAFILHPVHEERVMISRGQQYTGQTLVFWKGMMDVEHSGSFWSPEHIKRENERNVGASLWTGDWFKCRIAVGRSAPTFKLHVTVNAPSTGCTFPAPLASTSFL
jgi:hypothetical protein